MIQTSDEGTSYCTQCEAWAKENAELKKQLKVLLDRFEKRTALIPDLQAVARAAEIAEYHSGPSIQLAEHLRALKRPPHNDGPEHYCGECRPIGG